MPQRRRALCAVLVALMSLQGCLSANTATNDEGIASDENPFPNHNPDEYECFTTTTGSDATSRTYPIR